MDEHSAAVTFEAGSAGPRVSVISIFFNASAYLAEALNSVLAQSFQDFELLLVDDGSTDESREIAQAYAARNGAQVRCLQHPDKANRGMSATRNLGLSEARGEFVAFIDSDDRWRPSKLKEQVNLLDRLPDLDAVGGAVNYWASHSGGEDRVVQTAHVRNRIIQPPEATLALYPLGKAHAPSMSDLMFRRSSILKVGGFEDTFRGAYEDQAFLAKFYLQSTMFVTDSVWSDYRLHPASCMAEVIRNGTYPEARLKFLQWFEKYLDRSPFRDDDRLRHALEQALRPHRVRGGSLRQGLSVLPYARPVVRLARSAFRRLRPPRATMPAILLYHRIADESLDPWGLAVRPAYFEEQLEWLTRNRSILPLAEFARRHVEGRLPREAIAITFDDGYASVARVAAPLLQKYGAQATVFLPAGLIPRRREFWWDDLERIVFQTTAEELSAAGSLVQLGSRRALDRIWLPFDRPRSSRQKAFRELWARMSLMRDADRERLIDDLRKQAGVPDTPRESHEPMNIEQLRSLLPDTIDFGSHGLTHPDLLSLNDEEQAREIRESIDACEELTGRSPRSFAYPHGRFDELSVKLVQEAGYQLACSAKPAFVNSRSDQFTLPRLAAGDWRIDDFRRRLFGTR